MHASRRTSTPCDNDYTTSAHREVTLMTPPPTPQTRAPQRKHKHRSNAERKKERNREKCRRKRSERNARKKARKESEVSRPRHEGEPSSMEPEKTKAELRCGESVEAGRTAEKKYKRADSEKADGTVVQAIRRTPSRQNDRRTITAPVAVDEGRTISRLGHPNAPRNHRSLSSSGSKHDDKSLLASEAPERTHKHKPLTTEVHFTSMNCKSRTPESVSGRSSTSPPSSPTQPVQLNYDSEEDHEQELDRLMTLHLAPATIHYSHEEVAEPQQTGTSSSDTYEEDTPSNTMHAENDRASMSPEQCAGPNTSSVLTSTFEFIRGMQHDQHELDAKCRRIEAEIKGVRHKVFKLEPKDFWKIKQFEKLLDLSMCLCHELFVAEYAFRDVLDTRSKDFGFDFSCALAKLQEEVMKMFGEYDGEVAKLREWHTCVSRLERA